MGFYVSEGFGEQGEIDGFDAVPVLEGAVGCWDVFQGDAVNGEFGLADCL